MQITIKNMGGHLIRVRVNDTDLGELKALQPYVLTVPAGRSWWWRINFGGAVQNASPAAPVPVENGPKLS